MLVNGAHMRTIWINPERDRLEIINQCALPHSLEILELPNLEQVCLAIKDMRVRGAGLIGAAAGYGMWLAAKEGPDDPAAFAKHLLKSAKALQNTRPTANNLAWAVRRQLNKITGLAKQAAIEAARNEAENIAAEDAEFCRQIGLHGKNLLTDIAALNKNRPVNILTHCNAGWLAFVDYGSALSPVFAAHDEGIPVHVWVDETRPRNQGASLTAWELARHGVPHDLIVDNAGGHLMQHGLVDIVITGADRVSRSGDAANKIGTYLKALAAKDNAVPFYIALPSSTFDFQICNGIAEIPIEERDPREVRYISGKTQDGRMESILLCPEESPARNWAFDVTPARLITGLITERGICQASENAIMSMFPEHAGQ